MASDWLTWPFGDSGGVQSLEPKWQREMRERLAKKAEPKAARRLGMAGEPIDVVPPSPLEETGFAGLEDFLKSPLPTESSMMGMARGELEATLGGEEYDPVGGAYYQAYRNAVMRELEESKNRLAAATSARDKYFGGGRIAATGELEEEAMGDLTSVLGSLYEAERERRLGAVPQAMKYAAAEEAWPMQRIEMALGAGEQQRGFAEREREEQLRQLTDLGIPLEVALGLITYKPDYLETTPAWSYMLGPAADIGSAAILAAAL